jgi:DNA-binding NtrC family response regulator
MPAASAQEDRPNSSIIMMTGHGDESTRKTAAPLGALESIHKPVDRSSLVGTVKQVLQTQLQHSVAH